MDTAKPLAKELRFYGKKENWSDFMKHLRTEFDLVVCTQVFEISTAWYTSSGAPVPVLGGIEKTARPEKIGNLLTDSMLTFAEVNHHVDIVWDDTVIGSVTEIFYACNPAPDETDYKKERETRRLKHVIGGRKQWGSLKPTYKIKLNNVLAGCKREKEIDGALLMMALEADVNTSTIVGTAGIKENMETKSLEDFKQDVKLYNDWYQDQMVKLTSLGEDQYNEHLRNLFRSYEKCGNEDFRKVIKDDKMKWMQRKMVKGYCETHLMEDAKTLFQNLEATLE